MTKQTDKDRIKELELEVKHDKCIINRLLERIVIGEGILKAHDLLYDEDGDIIPCKILRELEAERESKKIQQTSKKH